MANPSRMAELTGVAFDAAQREVGPVQLNIPRDFFYGESATTIPTPNVIERSAGGAASLARAADIIARFGEYATFLQGVSSGRTTDLS